MFSALLRINHSDTTGIIDRIKGIDWHVFSDEIWGVVI